MGWFVDGVNIGRPKFSSFFLNLDNLSPEKVAYIWQIEWVQIDAIKFEDESTGINKMVFSDRFFW